MKVWHKNQHSLLPIFEYTYNIQTTQLKGCAILQICYKWENSHTEKKFWIRLSGKVNNIISTWVLIYNFHLIWNLFFIYNQLMWHNVNPIYRKYFCGTIHINKRKPGGRFKPNDTIQSSQILPLHHCCYLNFKGIFRYCIILKSLNV